MPDLIINETKGHEIEKAFRIAMGDLFTNIQYYKSGMLEQEKSCLLAGFFYDRPWTRDAAMNTWNGFGLLFPQEAKNTLLAQAGKNENSEPVIIGQYWDRIIWIIGAWYYYLYTGDKEFLSMAYQTTVNTLKILEDEEFTSEMNLFRGAAVYGDGISAYPLVYAQHDDNVPQEPYSCILDWVHANPTKKADKGYGLPMHALSTNCVYFQAYKLLADIEKELELTVNSQWLEKANKIKQAINKHFWDSARGTYNYLVDPFGNCNSQEGMGLAYAILFGVADSDQIQSIFKNAVIEPAGIPCVYPSFERYRNEDIDSYGRHSGTIWPHIQGFWADAAKKHHHYDAFLHEFINLYTHALRDNQFVEIYHPKTGKPYGGLQEPTHEQFEEYFISDRQAWSATAYVSMIIKDIMGMNFDSQGISFDPFLPQEISEIGLRNLTYRDAVLDIYIHGNGTKISTFQIDGQDAKPFINADIQGHHTIQITVVK